MVHGGGLHLPPLPSLAQGFGGATSPALLVPPRARAVPTRIRIPALRVDAPVTGLGLDSAGRLQAPADTDRNLTGWYRDGITPGQRGTAIVAGHVDTRDGPAVFYDLGTLHKGDQVEITGEDRGSAFFVVDAVEVYSKKGFPDAKVYGPAPDSQLRLITCGGGFSAAKGYDANVVVFAHLVRSLPGS
ncbi:class F sortase [Kitasatospora sp. GP82]|uniref:class F sortase n=1 Tax=Kitasatospora sp. GP82 TaxID=3035089 RepID=UPI0024737ABD|nr:class F sortase [Kitasatospora sp. GP82]